MPIDIVQRAFWEKNGYLPVKQILDAQTLQNYRKIYDELLDDQKIVNGHRFDLSGESIGKEKIVQIMCPSILRPDLEFGKLHIICAKIARSLLGEDVAFDFDMLIDKPSFNSAKTPWHQDRAYWIDMPDTRALSCWVALDDTSVDNGCMWYVPGSHLKQLRRHAQLGHNGPLECKATESEAIPVPLKAGDMVIHEGGTIHYSRANNTAGRRRAVILNYRPIAMIKFERERGFDHLGVKTIRNEV